MHGRRITIRHNGAMIDLILRPMTSNEFEDFHSRLLAEYAAVNADAGNWSTEEADELSIKAMAELLPEGLETPDALLCIAENSAEEMIGHLWVGLKRGAGLASPRAWIFDIEVAQAHRGKGYGRALLVAAEQEIAHHGVGAVGLNVFGTNTIARSLYESAGYDITQIQMRKELPLNQVNE